MADSYKKGAKIKAGKLLTTFLKEISNESTELVIDPATGEDKIVTKAEALAREIWKRALGYTSSEVKGSVLKETVHIPDKSMMVLIFDRLEGKVPILTGVGKKGVTAAERISVENTKRLNSYVASDNRKT